jgi:hypothetical protein
MSKDAIIHAWRGGNEGLLQVERFITAAKNGYNTVLSNGYYIDLMLSVDSHYLNDPLQKHCSFSGREARILGGCYVERTCGAFEHRFKKYGLELPQLPKDYGQMILLPI